MSCDLDNNRMSVLYLSCHLEWSSLFFNSLGDVASCG